MPREKLMTSLTVIRALTVAMVTCSVLAVGCGGDSSSGGGGNVVVCGAKPAACGGNIVGKWQLESFCLNSTNVDTSSLNCPGVTATVTSATVTGTEEFRTDGTETSTSHGTSQATYVFPASCLKVSCADTPTALKSNPDISAASCSQSGDKCTCTVTITTDSTSEYTYTVSDSKLTETDTATSETTVSDYCVSGDELTGSNDEGTYTAKRQ
jgi:hypothetical protein